MWLFREHRGGLKESMKTCKSFNTLKDLIEYASQKSTYLKCCMSDIQLYLYCIEDERIGWNPVYIVCVKNEVIGFCTEFFKVISK